MSEQPNVGRAPRSDGQDSGAGGAGTLYYWDYLGLDKLLDSQHLVSEQVGKPAHDEMLFIIVHQAYEIWFKQILWELGAVMKIMAQDPVPERDVGRAVHLLERITEIQRLLIAQIDVLETMTPLDFLDFRDELVPASGFQSVQMRLIENVLGVDPEYRLRLEGDPYYARLAEEHAQIVLAAESGPTLLDLINQWLARTPFLHFGEFDFWDAYRQAVNAMIAREKRLIETNPTIEDARRDAELEQFTSTVAHFDALFDRERYEALVEKENRKLSHEALLAALLINLYRDEPILHMPFRLLTALVDIDEKFATWRDRHVLLVHRMIGGRIGTGGTSGHKYLRRSAERLKVFDELFDIATFLLPRSELPELPDEVRAKMGFRLDVEA
jgi:tryptophan 2,3-dioxygenase